MKKITMIIVTVMVLLSTQTKAQGFFSDFFAQKKAMLKNAAKQIAALKIYTSYLEKGYDIAHKGLGTISDIKRGDFSIHSNHFNALMEINPSIKKYGRVADIIALEIQTVQSAKEIKGVLSSSIFGEQEMDYIQGVLERLVSAASQTLSDLIDVITRDHYQLTDDERIHRIDQIYDQMLDQYEFSQDFSDDVSALRLARSRSLREIQDSRLLYGIDY